MHSAVFAVNPKSAGELALRFVGRRRSRLPRSRGHGRRRGASACRLGVRAPARLPEGAGGAPPRPGCEDEDARGRAGSPGGHREPSRRARPRRPDVVRRAGHDDESSAPRARAREDAPRRRRRSGTERCSSPTRTSRRCSSSPPPGRRASWSRPWAARGSSSGAETSSSRRRSSSVSGGTGSWSIATEAKIAALGGAPLRVDTGDPALDESLSGYLRVIVAHNREIVYRIAP